MTRDARGRFCTVPDLTREEWEWNAGEAEARAERAEAELTRFRSAVEALADDLTERGVLLVSFYGDECPTCRTQPNAAMEVPSPLLRALLTEGRDRAGEGAGS